MADFVIKQGDRLPELQVTLTDSTGAAVDLAGATVRFHMRALNGKTTKVDAAATLVTPAEGVVSYAWMAGDTDTTGSYNAEFEVTFGDGRNQTFPNPGYIVVRIDRKLG